jgi:diaminopimelate epimerase
MKFSKMHGLGNSYVYVNEFETSLPEASLPGLASKVSDVHFGVGSDGLILIGPSKQAEFRMRIFNADGSEARNCGNGLRCVAKYVYDRGMINRTHFSIETLGGNVQVEVHPGPDGKVSQVTVDMGRPRFERRALPMTGDPDSTAIDEELTVGGQTYRLTAVSMGNPHAVFFVPDVDSIPIAELGPEIERSPLFPERVNVEFVRVLNRRELAFRVWERGSGITLACGTGACAAVAAGVVNRLLDPDVPVTVHLPGGDLDIVWKSQSNIYMKGPAEWVMDGEWLGGL